MSEPEAPFDRHDPKYYSNCCCTDVHITTLAGLYTLLAGMACFFTFWISGDPLPLLHLPLLCFGVFAINKESSLLLICYVTFSIIAEVCWAYRVVIHIAANPPVIFDKHGFTYKSYLIIPLFIFVCFIIGMYTAYYKTIQFCQDRDCSPEPAVVFKAEKPIGDTIPSVSSAVDTTPPVIVVPSTVPTVPSCPSASDTPSPIGWKTVEPEKVEEGNGINERMKSC